LSRKSALPCHGQQPQFRARQLVPGARPPARRDHRRRRRRQAARADHRYAGPVPVRADRPLRRGRAGNLPARIRDIALRRHMHVAKTFSKRIMIVYGTRPEAIKLAPVIKTMRESRQLRPIVTVTGQHRSIVDQVHAMFGIIPDHDLDVIRPQQSLDGLTARVLSRVTEVLRTERPDAVIVQGDTTSAFAGALAAFYERIPVVHVEAGLRTDDIYSPFPEEVNRRLTSRIASLHLA